MFLSMCAQAVREILAHGADPMVVDGRGYSALALASGGAAAHLLREVGLPASFFAVHVPAFHAYQSPFFMLWNFVDIRP